jgi:hypothetical protein
LVKDASIKSGRNRFVDLYVKLPHPKEMIYSFKPLKLESFYTEKEINELLGL